MYVEDVRLSFPVRFAIANGVAELVGLGAVGALVGWLVGALGPEHPAFGASVIAAGALEGAIVGAVQSGLVRERLPGIRSAAWIAATIAGALVAWSLGMLPSSLLGDGGGEAAPAPQIPPAVELLLAAVLGAVTGPVLGGFQAAALRRHTPRWPTWILANAIAWAAAMPIVFAAAGGMPAHGPDAAWIALALASLFAAGFVAGAIEGLFLERIQGEARAHEGPGPLAARSGRPAGSERPRDAAGRVTGGGYEVTASSRSTLTGQ